MQLVGSGQEGELQEHNGRKGETARRKTEKIKKKKEGIKMMGYVKCKVKSVSSAAEDKLER